MLARAEGEVKDAGFARRDFGGDTPQWGPKHLMRRWPCAAPSGHRPEGGSILPSPVSRDPLPVPPTLQGRTGCATGGANAFEGRCPIPPTPFPAAQAAGKGAFFLLRGCPRAAKPPADTPFIWIPCPRRGGGGVRGGGLKMVGPDACTGGRRLSGPEPPTRGNRIASPSAGNLLLATLPPIPLFRGNGRGSFHSRERTPAPPVRPSWGDRQPQSRRALSHRRASAR